VSAEVVAAPDTKMPYRVRSESISVLLLDGEISIGRSSRCNLVLEHASVSRVHASLRAKGDLLEIVDLGSRHGTFVRGARIRAPAPVRPGDKIMLGSASLYIERVRTSEPFVTPDHVSLIDDAS
jgi:pSer/pThr/pTyr-binding forkhead associated (FHA) protein